MQTASVQVAADLVGHRIQTKICNQAKRQELAKKANIQATALPYFQATDSLLLTDSTAIAQFIIRQNQAKAGALLGSTPFAEAAVNQLVAMASSAIIPKVRTIEATVFGTTVNPDAHAAAVKDLKEACKVLNTLIGDKAWLNGQSMTFADVHVFMALAPAFQLTLDAGFRKAMPALAAWFEKMSKLPAIVGRVGFIKPCMKALPPAKKA